MDQPIPKLDFQIATGSVTGRDHATAGKNNQDAAFWLKTATATATATALLVCDGCSSGEHSEAGAWAGARIVAHAMLESVTRQGLDVLRISPDQILEDASREALCKLRELAKLTRLPGTQDLLFTIVGALITEDTTVLFSIGDGLLAINDEVIVIGPFPGNAPPYLAYGLEDNAPSFQIHRVLQTNDVQSLLIGTDGVVDLYRLAAQTLPGRCEAVGPLKQFWQEERYFKNADMIRRRLALINRCAATPDWEHRSIDRQIGLLRDDTTFIVARRIAVQSAIRSPQYGRGDSHERLH